MDWDQADPRTEIDGRIAILEEDRAAWQHQLDDAHAARVRGEHLIDGATAALTRAQHVADGARAQEDDARRHVDDDTAEIAILHRERDAIIPTPRPPA